MSSNRFRASSATAFASAALATLILAGCGETNGPGNPPAGANAESAAEHDEHAHPTEGPHHGDLVELGNEEYHAEVVHADGGEVAIYILDGNAKQAVPIDASEITINLTHEGEAEQFKLTAAPDAGDPAGKSSRFTLKDEHLTEDLDAEGTVAKVVITINGKQYTGKIEHDHDHEGHDHAH